MNLKVLMPLPEFLVTKVKRRKFKVEAYLKPGAHSFMSYTLFPNSLFKLLKLLSLGFSW